MQRGSLQFQIHPSSGVPIYRQLIEQIRALVVGGQLPSGEMLPSVRQLAADLEINMMTASKAYARLEAEGVIERVRGMGMRVRGAKCGGSLAERREQLRPLADPLVTRGRQLGLTDDQILAVVTSVLKERQR
jgi:GntR family transcriptional regulator